MWLRNSPAFIAAVLCAAFLSACQCDSPCGSRHCDSHETCELVGSLEQCLQICDPRHPRRPASCDGDSGASELDAGGMDAGSARDAGREPDAGMSPDDAGAACEPYEVSAPDRPDFVRSTFLDGLPVLATGGGAGRATFVVASDGAPVDVLDLGGFSTLYVIDSFDAAHPDGDFFLSLLDRRAVMHQRFDGAFGFGQGLYGINPANVVQSAFLRSDAGVVTGVVLANNASGRVDLFELDSFLTWSRSAEADPPGIERLAGIATVPGTRVVIAATDSDPSRYFAIDFDRDSSDPEYIRDLGSAGSGARHGACIEGLCAFAEFDEGAITLIDASASPVAIAETRAIGPTPLGIHPASLDGQPVLITMTADDVIHLIGGAAGAIDMSTAAAPGTCAASAGPRTAIVFGDSCIAATCNETGSERVRVGPM